MKNKQNNTLAVIALIVALLAALGAGLAFNVAKIEIEEPVARSYNTACYEPQGGASVVAGSGCTWEMQSGSTLNIQPGATANLNAGVSTTGTLTANALVITTTSSLGGNISSATGYVTFTDSTMVDGAADVVQLLVQGYATQTTTPLVYEQSDGTDIFWVTNIGDMELNGTTPSLTLGDADEEDASLLFDGNAQDYYVGLDDTEDDLVIGLGLAVGTTPAISIDESQNTDVAGTLQFGANNLYPVGYASSGQQLVYGTASMTGTLVAPHGLTTVTFCLCSLGEDPTAGAGDAAMCTVAVAGNACTLKTWQDDFVTAATETSVVVQWIVVGAP